MSHVTLNGVSFEFPNGREIFKNLNISLDSRLTALVGPNGIGKSTLAKLIAKELEPTSGKIQVVGSVTYFSQREEAPPLIIQEYLGDEYSWSKLGEQLLKGINRESLCSTLSGGEWMRVRLAKILDHQFLILDEPTNDLDREGREALLEFLKHHRGGILLISHDRESLELCDEVLELSNKGLNKFGGRWNDYVEYKNHERDNLAHSLDVAKRERNQKRLVRIEKIQKQEKRNRKGKEKAAKGGIPKILLGGMKRRAQVTTAKVDVTTLEKAQLAVTEAYSAFENLKHEPIMYAELLGDKIPNQKLVAEAKGFNIYFDRWIYEEALNFVWRGNIRIHLKGHNGSGKSSLIKAFMGAQLCTRGEFKSGNLKTLYIDQTCSSLDETKSILENVNDRNGLAKFLFTNDQVFQKVSELSGGERLRATLAKAFLSSEKPELLILDEPTNNLDLNNVEFLENLIQNFKGALVVISHDQKFVENCKLDSEVNLNP